MRCDDTRKIIEFLKKTYRKTPAIIGVSGGLDSAVVLTLLAKSIPKDNIIPVLMPYGKQSVKDALTIIKFNKLSEGNVIRYNIRKAVDVLSGELGVNDDLREGNIRSRVRMIILFDIAKRNYGYVCGTENRTEKILGYYTRYGDSASDVEPIIHLLKTEVRELARELKIPQYFIDKAPSAELHEGQTDEGDFGFTYDEADKVIREIFDVSKVDGVTRKMRVKVLTIIGRQSYKNKVPYTMWGENNG